MKRRLRKKKRLGEFKELGFELLADLRPSTSESDLREFVDRLIAAVEARQLGFGGGAGHSGKLEGFVTRLVAAVRRRKIASRSPHSSRGTLRSFITTSESFATLGTSKGPLAKLSTLLEAQPLPGQGAREARVLDENADLYVPLLARARVKFALETKAFAPSTTTRFA